MSSPGRIRFIITGFMRSGSNLLLTSLEQNPAVRVYAELFNQAVESRPDVAGRVYEEGDPGDEFLDHVFATPQAEAVRAVGFKWFGFQARGSLAARRAWRRFREDCGIRVIYLARRDWLSMVVSRTIAEQLDTWSVRQDAPADAHTLKQLDELGSLHLEPELCASRFDEIALARQAVLEDAIDHPLLELTYEDLTRNLQDTLNRAFAFLDVAPCAVRARHQKMNRLTARQRLANYPELQAYFASTHYARFFPAEDGAPSS